MISELENASDEDSDNWITHKINYNIQLNIFNYIFYRFII